MWLVVGVGADLVMDSSRVWVRDGESVGDGVEVISGVGEGVHVTVGSEVRVLVEVKLVVMVFVELGDLVAVTSLVSDKVLECCMLGENV